VSTWHDVIAGGCDVIDVVAGLTTSIE